MGFFDFITDIFKGSGATAAQIVVANQPRTSTGGTYVSNQTQNISSGQIVDQSRITPQQIVQQEPVRMIASWGAGAISMVSGAASPVISRAASVAIPAAAFIAAPIAMPAIVGGTVVKGVQNFVTPQQPQVVQVTPKGGNVTAGADWSRNVVANVNQSLPKESTFYVPWGERRQIEITNAKATIDPTTGELGIYQQPYGHSIMNLVSSGGRAAAQSGMFSQGGSLTPVVASQATGKPITPEYTYVPASVKAADVIASPASYSRLGAELYGGMVQRLDARTVESTGAQLSTYPAYTGNLANLVSPTGVNLTKAEAPGANVPWSIPVSSPTIQYMDKTGITGPAPNAFVMKGAAISGGGMMGSSPAVAAPATPAISETVFRPSELQLMLQPKSEWSLEGLIVRGGEAVASVPLVGDVVKTGGQIIYGKDIFTPALEVTRKGEPVYSEGITTYGEQYQTVKDLGGGSYEITTFTPSTTTQDVMTPVTKTITPVEGLFSQMEKAWIVPKTTGKLPEWKYTGESASLGGAAQAILSGGYTALKEKPGTAVVYAASGALLVLGGEALAGYGAATTAATAGTRIGTIARGAELFVTRVAPPVLGGLFITDIAMTGLKPSTKSGSVFDTEWRINPTTQSLSAMGGRISTELIPMTLGGMGAAYRNQIAAGGIRTLQEIDARLPTIQQRAIPGRQGDVLIRAGPQLFTGEITIEPVKPALSGIKKSARVGEESFRPESIESRLMGSYYKEMATAQPQMQMEVQAAKATTRPYREPMKPLTIKTEAEVKLEKLLSAIPETPMEEVAPAVGRLQQIVKTEPQKVYAPDVMTVDLSKAAISQEAVPLTTSKPVMTVDLPFYYAEKYQASMFKPEPVTYDPFTGMSYDTRALKLPKQETLTQTSLLRSLVASRELALPKQTPMQKTKAITSPKTLVETTPSLETRLMEYYGTKTKTKTASLTKTQTALKTETMQKTRFALKTDTLQKTKTALMTDMLTAQKTDVIVASLTATKLKTKTITDTISDRITKPRTITGIDYITKPATRTTTETGQDWWQRIIPTTIITPGMGGWPFDGAGGGASPFGMKGKFRFRELLSFSIERRKRTQSNRKPAKKRGKSTAGKSRRKKK